jgi:biopolymer transport protein ExbD
MRLTKRKRRPAAPGLNLAAMVDVVFLLLIFFMCTARFRAEKTTPAQLVRSGVAENKQLKLAPIWLQVGDEDGSRVDGPGRQFRSLRDLEAFLVEIHRNGDRPVVIRGEPNVAVDALVAVLDVCHRAGLWKVGFAIDRAG